MRIDNNLHEKSIKILTDLISFKTISGSDNSELIDYCEKILNDLNIETFKVFDNEKKRVNLFGTLKAKKPNGKKLVHLGVNLQTLYLQLSTWMKKFFLCQDILEVIR